MNELTPKAVAVLREVEGEFWSYEEFEILERIESDTELIDMAQHLAIVEQLKARVAEQEAELAKLLAGQESLLLNLADQKRQSVEYREMWAKASERAHSQSSALYARQVPEGWRVERRELDGSVYFIIGSPRIVGVRSNTSVWESDSDPTHLLLWHLLAASTGQEAAGHE